MNEPQPQPAGPEKVDIKQELEKQKIQLHNARFQVQMIEALVKKQEELLR